MESGVVSTTRDQETCAFNPSISVHLSSGNIKAENGKNVLARTSGHLDNNDCVDTDAIWGTLCCEDLKNPWISHVGASVPSKENKLITPHL